MLHPTLLFVPLDDRPVCFDLVVRLANAVGMLVRTPERALLGDRYRAGDLEGLWAWLDREVASDEAHVLIASAEMLCFGGLVASRKSGASFEEIAPLLDRLENAGRRMPTYVSAVIPRTPQQPSDEDAAHWHVKDADALRSHRERQLRINDTLLGAAARGAFRYLLIGQDDTAPGSAGAAERDRLQARLDAQEARNVLLTTGADELNGRLLAHWLNDLTGLSPSVRIVYTYPEAVSQIPRYESTPLGQTVEEHVESTGCHVALEAVDILLWVHNFEGAQLEARDHAGAHPAPIDGPRREVRAAVAEEQVVALADVRFANGADRALVSGLLEEPRFAGIVAYGGWNTCSNTLGSTLAQAVVAYHLRTHSIAGSDRLYRPVLLIRILDDWGYQAVVRPHLADWLAGRGSNAAALGDLERETEKQAAGGLQRDALPLLQASFRHHPLTLRTVTFPWHRLFEVNIDLDVRRVGRMGPEGNVVIDHNPAWAVAYEQDRAAITGVLGGMVRGIEHVGSTSVSGLAAKPIIDIMLGVDASDLDRIIEPLRSIGYEYNPDWEISMPQRRYFRRLLPDGTNTHHLHAVPIGGEFWERHLRFRNFLRANPQKAEEYGALKKEIARQHQQGSIDYTFAKSEFIRSVEAMAGVPPRMTRSKEPRRR